MQEIKSEYDLCITNQENIYKKLILSFKKSSGNIEVIWLVTGSNLLA